MAVDRNNKIVMLDAADKLTAPAAVTLAGLATTPVIGHVLQSTDVLGSLDWVAPAAGGSGVFTPTINSNTMVEVSQESDFGTLVGNTRTLEGNTTYFIRGQVNCTNLLAITNSGTSIRGWDRDTARLSYVGVAGLGNFITITDVSCELIGIEFQSTNSTAGDIVIRATDFDLSKGIATGNLGQAQLPPSPPSPWTGGGTKTSGNAVVGQTMTGLTSGATATVDVWILIGLVAVDVQTVNSQTFVVGETVQIPAYTCGGCGDSEWTAPVEYVLQAADINYLNYNAGRDKVLTIINCQFRDCFDVHHIEGFDLVDIQNCLFWYIEATTMGCHFKNVSKLQISSCEYVRWFDETSLPTPSGYATTPMIELRANGVNGPGFGAVNIGGTIIHPQQTQDGLRIQPGSTTGFGTITGNTFINAGLTPNSHQATITLTGTTPGGTANVLIGGYQNYLATFNADLTTTASDFVTAYAQELAFRYGITLTSSGVDIIFTSAVAGAVFYITSITNDTADLSGTLVHGTPINGVVADLEPNSQNSFIIQGNQGLENANVNAGLIIQDNANAFTAPTAYQTLNATNVGGSFTNSPYFPKARRVITDRDACSITYNSKNPGSFFVAVNATVDGNNGFVTCRLIFTRGGVTTSVPFATGVVELKGSAETLSFTTLGQARPGDIFEVEFLKSTGDLKVTDFTLNGYQF